MLRHEIRGLLASAMVVLFLCGYGYGRHTFVAGLNAGQVVPSSGSTARAVCTAQSRALFSDWYAWLDVNCNWSGLSSPMVAAEMFLAPIPQPVCDLATTGGTGGVLSSTCGPIGYGFPSSWDYVAMKKSLRLVIRTQNFPNGEIQGTLKPMTLDYDMDGDGRTDPFVFRPDNFHGYMFCSTDGDTVSHLFDRFSGEGHSPFMADFDGDGLADVADTHMSVISGGSMSTVYTRSSDNVFVQVPWGNANLGDQVANADYDGDGKIDIAVFRETDGNWYIRQSSDGQMRVDHWGMTDDKAVPGDYDNDGKADLAIVRSENGRLVWYIRRSSDGTYYGMQWGLSSDTFYPGKPVDLDADGANDILVSRDVAGSRYFYGLQSSNGALFARQWGFTSDAVKLGDFDGDGKTEIAAIRNSDASLVWYFSPGADGQMKTLSWGLPGDQ